ncbi:hypothetical protein EMPS_08396 [Entomortierella parvispora]|uniref:Myb-like domain-containing protein n=1 Tax=Entomortierella parvispora TaxID=205924 RepID=A0A9P3HGS9_9FUNG|nr:hypothetical protein EMPS_08396 [Entomortierella parvispora]
MYRTPLLLRSLQRTFAPKGAARPCTPAPSPSWTCVLTRPQSPRRLLSSKTKEHEEQSTMTEAEISSEVSGKIKARTKAPKGQVQSFKWTNEMDNMVTELRAQNKTWDYIGLAVGRPSTACSDRYYTCLDPALKNWTPAMFAKLDEMVEANVPWRDISNTLGAVVISCQHQWRTLGRGKYKIQGMGISLRSKAQEWSRFEVDGFWRAWITHGDGQWADIAKDLGTRSANECRRGFKALVVAALKDAPGWVKIEASNYVAEVIKAARERADQDTSDIESSHLTGQGSSKWTSAEHRALLEAVEKYGLFSGWTRIRMEVKPEVKDVDVESEYYRLSGVSMSSESNSSPNTTEEGLWTKDEIEKFSRIMMRFSTVPTWVEEAGQQEDGFLQEDPQKLFWGGSPVGTSIKKRGRPRKCDADALVPGEFVWTRASLARLSRLVGQQRLQESLSGHPVNWQWVADHIGPGVSANMCISAWQTAPKLTVGRQEPAKYWDEADVDMLIKGIRKHGRGWINVRKEFLKDRTTDSIRRKVSNLENVRDRLILKTKRAIPRFASMTQEQQREALDDALKDNPVLLAYNQLKEAFQEHDRKIAREGEKNETGEGNTHP